MTDERQVAEPARLVFPFRPAADHHPRHTLLGVDRRREKTAHLPGITLDQRAHRPLLDRAGRHATVSRFQTFTSIEKDHQPDAAASPRVRTPTILQMEATECGSVSLGIILAYHGCHIPADELRNECRVSRDGSNALYVKKTAEKYGLVSKGLRMTADELKTLAPPFVVFWEAMHFLVVEGFAGGRVYLNDPASGRRSLDEQRFRRIVQRHRLHVHSRRSVP